MRNRCFAISGLYGKASCLLRRLPWQSSWDVLPTASTIGRGTTRPDFSNFGGTVFRPSATVASTRYAISVPFVLDHLDDKRIELRHALKSNRVQIGKGLLIGIYETEHALRVRIGRLDGTDWRRKLDAVMAMVATDLQTELQTLPGNIHHVLGSIPHHHNHPASGICTAELSHAEGTRSHGPWSRGSRLGSNRPRPIRAGSVEFARANP